MSYIIRPAVITDLPLLQRLFYNTMTAIGIKSKSFSKAQIETWTKNASDKMYWKYKFLHNNFYVAMLNGEIVGFISLSAIGHLDYVYVFHKYQGIGIASRLYDQIEKIAKESNFMMITSDVSSIAKPFFEKKGFEILAKHSVQIDGEVSINYSMKKMI